MDLPPLNNNAKSAPASTNASAASGTSLLDIGKLAAGSQLTAQVESIAPINAKLRAQLLAFYTQTTATPAHGLADKSARSLSTAQTSASTNAQNAAAQASQSLVALLNKPELFAVQLSALGKRVLTFTEFPFPLKQRIPVFIRGDGQLQINTAALNKQSLSPLSAKQGATLSAPSTASYENKPVSTPILNEGLRRYLPLQSKLSQAFTQLQEVKNQVNLLATLQASNRDNTSLNQGNNYREANTALKTLASRLDTILTKAPELNSQLSSSALKNAIINSGALLESKLRTDSSLLPRPNPISPALAQSTGNITTNANGPLRDDLKAELLGIINELAKLLPSTSAAAGHKPSAASTGAIEKLLQSLFSHSARPQAETTQQNATAQAALAANQRALPALIAALARISGLQIQHLTQQDGLSQSAGTFLELPIKIGEHFYPLTLQIQEKTEERRQNEEERKKDREKDRSKRKKWQVFMEFDLDEHGTFASEVNVEENRVNTRLWVQKESLWSASKNHLAHLQSELESAGIVVEHLSCQQGSAPEKRTQLRQSLVDIRT